MSGGGHFDPIVRPFPIITTAVRRGAFVRIVPAAAPTLLLGTAATLVSYLGLAQETIAVGETTDCQVALTPTGTVLEADVSDIVNGTAIAADSGSATTFVQATYDSPPTHGMVGSIFQVVAKAANPTQVGNKLTITAFTTGTGSFTFATTTSLFAAADTIKLLTLGKSIIGAITLSVDPTYADSILLNQATGLGTCFRVIGLSNDKKRLHLVLLNGFDSTTTLATS